MLEVKTNFFFSYFVYFCSFLLLYNSGQIVLGNGTATVDVPLGSFLTGCVGGVCSGFESCPAGWVSNGVVATKDCTKCASGTTSFSGTTFCRTCAKGKFNSEMGSAVCKNCLVGFYQPNDVDPINTLSCIECPTGFAQPTEGAPNCIDLGGKKPSDCTDDEYFNATLKSHNDDGTPPGDCVKCPMGASCVGHVTFSGVKAKFGWARCPNLHRNFTRCVGNYCLGAPNPMLVNLMLVGTFDNGTLDPALRNDPEGCAEGHWNNTNNTRCSKCQSGWAPISNAQGKCQKCTDKAGMLVLVVFILFIVLIMFVVMITLKMKSKGSRKAIHSTIKRTVLTHVQMVSIVMSLNVPWPETVRVVMVGVSNVVSVAGQTDSIQCSVETQSVADVFFGTLIVAVILPAVVAGISGVYWLICVPKCPALGCAKGIRMIRCCELKRNPFATRGRSIWGGGRGGGEKTPDNNSSNAITPPAINFEMVKWKSNRDGFIITNVTFLYIAFPSIARMSFQTFQCQTICGLSYLAKDASERCWIENSKHQKFVFFVALPALLLYVLITPSLALLLFYARRNTLLKDKKFVFRFGLLFSGYSKTRWFWELFVIARKLILILIVTFGQTNQSQLHYALGALIVVLFLQEHGRPFEEEDEDEEDEEGEEMTNRNSQSLHLFMRRSRNRLAELQKKKKKKRAENLLLHRMEIVSLLVLLYMVWSSVFFTLGRCVINDATCVLLSIVVFASNILFFIVCSYTGLKSFGKRVHLDDKLRSSVEMVVAKFKRWSTDTSKSGDGNDNVEGGGRGPRRGQSTSTFDFDETDNQNGEMKIHVNPMTKKTDAITKVTGTQK